jgi:glutamate-1-semialdehyde aminotransferase
MLPDAVITIIPNGKLSALLSAIHSDGMGYLARIATVERGPLLDQLQRAGIPVSQAPAAVADAEQVLFVNAGGRAQSTASLLMRHGAQRAWIVNAHGAWVDVDDTLLTTAPVAPRQFGERQDVPGRCQLPPEPATQRESLPEQGA